jgi:hypothetical protein
VTGEDKETQSVGELRCLLAAFECARYARAGPLFHPGQPAIELVGECLLVSGAEVRRPAGDQAPATESIDQIPDGESLADIRISVQFAARIDGLAPFRDHVSGQRNISRNHQITGHNQFDNASIGDVHPPKDADTVDEPRRRGAHGLIGDERHFNLTPLRGAIQQRFDFARTRVSVNPNLHGATRQDVYDVGSGPRLYPASRGGGKIGSADWHSPSHSRAVS